MITDILVARHAFSELAALDDQIFPLDRAALALALEEYPTLHVESYLRKLDTFAARVEALIGDDRTPSAVLEAMNEVLFFQEGLRGNSEDYYDPRNSYLNEVLDRKLGIPISLSVIYMEVARRLTLDLQGVGFPGHFIVKVANAERETLIDPFNHGQVINEKQCQELLDKVYGGSLQVLPAYFRPMEKKAIISRMLYNLKGIYYQKEDYRRALSVVERILIINPGTPSEIRDRGLLYMQTSLFAKALSDLEHYLADTSSPPDVSYIEGHVKTLRRIVSATN